ncbi:MAG: hypothetical protein GY856_51650 [bacterium]|nr:hypothetical protein [bacterium]
MWKRPFVPLAALWLCGLILACGTVPDERLVAATRLLDEARSLQAENYVPDALRRAEELLAQAEAELAAQKDRIAFLRTYHKARKLLDEAQAAARWVRMEAAAASVEARQAAHRAVAEARLAFERAGKAFRGAPRGKDTLIDLERMAADLAALREALTEAEVRLAEGDFLAARKQGKDVSREAQLVAYTIEQAMKHR